jgi:hypothetical protein
MSSIPPFIPLTPILPLVPSLTEVDLQLSMPDFANLLRIDPATPSPLKQLRGDFPTILTLVYPDFVHAEKYNKYGHITHVFTIIF